jgi:hypothetical protein
MASMPWVNEKDRLVPIVTDEAVALFKRGLEIHRAGTQRDWEEQGGARREFLDVCVRLHALLGRKPWQADVLEIDSETPPAWMTQEDQRVDRCSAHVLRLQLLAALAERGAKP